MKRVIMIALLAIVAMAGRAQKTVVWEQPVIGYTKYNYFKIQKVELAKDRTSLYMSITYPSEAWFRFSPDSYIEADGKRYAITGSDSIELGKEAHTSPQTMKKDFVLHFQPLPQKTKVFDMLESTQKNDFTFFYIHPSDYMIPETPVPADFCADYLEEDVWPDNVFSEEPAVVHFKALNYKKGMDAEIRTMYFDITNPNSYNELRFFLDDEGCADFSCKVYFPTTLQFAIPSTEGTSFARPHVAPGKEVTILIDMLRDSKFPNTKVVGYKGFLAKFNKESDSLKGKEDVLGLPMYPDSYEKYKTVSDIANLHDSMKDAYDKLKGISNAMKQRFMGWELRFFSVMSDECSSLFNTQEFRDYVYRTHPRCFYGDFLRNDFDLKDVASLFVNTKEKGLGPDLIRFVHSMSELTSGIVNPKPLLDDPNLSRLYDQKRQEVTAELNHLKEGLTENVHYLELAEVTPENTLQFLLDRYKGKTIMIDMWATWCGPCIQGHRAMEPMKQELKDKDIVYLYITFSTSPFDDWKAMVKNIPGEHYYLSPEQFEALDNLYQSGGAVPTYAIYNSKGELVFHCVGFVGAEPLKEGLLKALK